MLKKLPQKNCHCIYLSRTENSYCFNHHVYYLGGGGSIRPQTEEELWRPLPPIAQWSSLPMINVSISSPLFISIVYITFWHCTKWLNSYYVSKRVNKNFKKLLNYWIFTLCYFLVCTYLLYWVNCLNLILVIILPFIRKSLIINN